MKDTWRKGKRTNLLQIVLGVVGLVSGLLVYVMNRPMEQVYFLKELKPYVTPIYSSRKILGPAGDSFPSFLHVFSFILITCGLMAWTKRESIIASLGWFFIDCGFEVAQKFPSWCCGILPHWFESVPFFENTENYFSLGTFDMLDLVFIGLGAAAACAVLLATENEGKQSA